MINKIQGEAPFQILASNFSIGPSNEGYTLQISADGENYSDLFTVGPNVTRLVTSVANGSFYRLAGNASEVSVNWERQCKDGQGGGGTGPQGPMGPQGPQGPAGSGGTGDSHILLASSGTPAGLAEGDVWAFHGTETVPVPIDQRYSAVTKTYVAGEAITFHFWVEASGGRIEETAGVGADGQLFGAWGVENNVIGGPWNNHGIEVSFNGSEVTFTTQIPEENIAAWMCDFNPPITEPKHTWHTYQVRNGVNKEIALKEDLPTEAFVHLDDLSTSGETGITYEYDEKLMYWNPESGHVAEWYISINNTPNDGATGLIFSDIPDGTVLFEMRASTLYPWRRIVYSGNTLFLMESDTVISEATIGNEFDFVTHTKGVYGYFGDHYIGFQKKSNTLIQNVWNGTVNSGHYELLDKANHPYFHDVTTVGIPEWGQDGHIKAKNSSVGTKDYYFNTTGTASTNKTTVLTNGTNSGPNRFFAPETVGTQGQILTSVGNGAPQWATLITAMQITSAEYEALTVKDPNTLYLIVDE